MNRVVVLAVLSLLYSGLAGVVTAPSAAAEEGCYAEFVGLPEASFLPCPNSWTGYGTGYAFYDDNSDAAPTMLRLGACTSNPDIDLLYYVETVGWQKVGTTRRLWCLNGESGWQSWGRQTAPGLYAFAIAGNRGTPLSGWLQAGW